MTTNACARVGLFLLGAYLIVFSLANATGIFTQQPIILKDSKASLDPMVLVIDFLSGAFMVIVFGLVPGAFIIARSAQWADQWFPTMEHERPLALAPSALYAVVLTILGIYFLVSGFGALLFGRPSAAGPVAERPSVGRQGAW